MNPNPSSLRRYAGPLLAALLIAGAAVRIYAAWTQRHCPSADYGVVALMAKHIAEGADFPLFFYGQSYMGSLEPAVSALICVFLGVRGFSVCLGTAAIAFFLLPLVYLWTRAAAGRAAALAATAFCVIGSGAYFDYLASPRGGYAVAVLFGTAVVWLAARVVVAERFSAPASYGGYALAGVLAGLAWWSDPLVAPALGTAALIGLVGLGRRAISLRSALAAALFLAGSLPWWIWNARNDWNSLEMSGSLGLLPWSEGLRRFGLTFLRLLDIHEDTWPAWQVLVGIFVFFALFVAVERIVRHRREGVRKPDDVYLVSALVLIAVDAFLAARSHFILCTEPRYLLPVWPALAVVMGTWTSVLFRRLRYGLGLLPLAALIAWQCPVLVNAYKESREFTAVWRQASALARFTEDHHIDALYGSYWKSWINFASGERVRLSGLEWERYAPYEKAAAQAQHVGVLNDAMAFQAFLDATGGRAAVSNVETFSIAYDVHPPQTGVTSLDSTRWSGATGDADTDLLGVLNDRNLDTRWVVNPRAEAATHVLVVSLKKPSKVAGIRLWSATGQYPFFCKIEAQSKSGGPWTRVLRRTENTSYFWSGPRFFYGGSFSRSEFMFPERKVAALRITLPDMPARAACEIAELEILELAPAPADPVESLPILLGLLKERGITFLYADRWVSERVYTLTAGSIGTHLEYLFTRQTDQLPREKTPEYPVVRFAPSTALLTPGADAALCRAALASRGIVMRETTVGPWVLFDVAPEQWNAEWAMPSELYWAGLGCFAGDPRKFAKQRAQIFYNEYLQRRKDATPESELRLLDRVLTEYPDYDPALADKICMLQALGRASEASALAERAYGAKVPAVPAEIAFDGGVSLLGVSVDAATVRPGDRFTMKYYWHCAPTVKPDRLAVFVHWKNTDAVFQDDHVLLSDRVPEEIQFQPFPEVFVTSRTVLVPESAPAGRYVLGLGLIDRADGWRLRAKTVLPQKHRKVELPVSIEVKS